MKNRISVLLLLLILLLCLFGCAPSGKLTQMEFIDPKENEEIQVYGEFDKQLSSEYFGRFEFVFRNLTEKWLSLDELNVTFNDDSAKKYIDVVSKERLVEWGKVIGAQKLLENVDENAIEKSVLSVSSQVTRVVGMGGLGDLLGWGPGETPESYPDNHLYSDTLIVPPGMVSDRWVLFNSREHHNIPYITDLYLNFTIDTTKYQTKLIFRERKDHITQFEWVGEEPDRWRFQLTPYLVMAGVAGEQTLGDGTFSSDSGIRPFWDATNWGAHAQAMKNRLGVSFELANINVGEKVAIPEELFENFSGNFNFDIFTWELLGFYRFPWRRWHFDLLGGVRYKKVRYEPQFDISVINVNFALKENWFDPVIGGHIINDIPDRVFIKIRADVGGFGLGSNFTWSGNLGFGYHLGSKTDALIQFGYQYSDYETGEEGTNGFFKYDAAELKTFLGLSFKL